MSLDVYLYDVKPTARVCECTCGHKHEETYYEELFHANITHNLNTIADKIGIYAEVWRPEEMDIKTANQMIEPLEKGLDRLMRNYNQYACYQPSNGWGTIDSLIDFLSNYLEACRNYPYAKVKVDR